MKHHWLLLGACGWVLLLLVFGSKYLKYSPTRGYSEPHNWTESVKSSFSPTVVSSAPSGDGWRAVMDHRRALLESMCRDPGLRNRTHTRVSSFVLDRVFVSDKHRVLFCQTPKVGNTQWKKVLIVLNGMFRTVEEIPENLVHNHEKNGLPRLSSYSPHEVTRRLSSYFKFLIVRDPFDRLISAFKDKFVLNPRFEPWYKLDIGPAIIKKYRRVHRSSQDTGSGLRFDDFVRYLGDTESGRVRLDRQFGAHVIHWLSFVELCAPCDITYDVIGHHETLEADAPFILRSAHVHALVSYPPIPPGITAYNRTKVHAYFNRISKRDARRLYERYEPDFRLFGYERPAFILD